VLRRALELVVLLVPLAWLARTVDLRATLGELTTVRLEPLLLAALGIGVSVEVGVLRWRLLLEAYGSDRPPSLPTLTRHNLASLYFNLLPGAVGGDLFRAYRVRDAAGGLATSLLVAFVDRLCGLVGLLLLVGLGALMGTGSPDPRVSALATSAVVLTSALALAVLLAPWLPARSPRLRALLERAPGPLAALGTLRPPRSAARLLLAVASSMVTQGAVVVALVCVLRAVLPTVSIGALLPVAPWVVLLIFAPLTPMGLGQRELVFVELWGLAGVPREAALGASILYLALGLLYALAGGATFAVERLRARRDSHAKAPAANSSVNTAPDAKRNPR